MMGVGICVFGCEVHGLVGEAGGGMERGWGGRRKRQRERKKEGGKCGRGKDVGKRAGGRRTGEEGEGCCEIIKTTKILGRMASDIWGQNIGEI